MANMEKCMAVLQICKGELEEDFSLMVDVTDIVAILPRKYRKVLQKRLNEVGSSITMMHHNINAVLKGDKE